MADIMFKVGDVDYSQNVVATDFNVQTDDVYKSWTDANGKEHRSVYRTQTNGTFTMFFPDIDTFNAFCRQVKSVKKNDTSIPCSVFDNINDNVVTGDFFLSYTPSRFRSATWDDRVKAFKMTIKER